jgi:hypothetical protein
VPDGLDEALGEGEAGAVDVALVWGLELGELRAVEGDPPHAMSVKAAAIATPLRRTA